MHPRLRSPARILLTGLLAALPLVVTLAIFGWLIGLLLRWLGPESLVGSLLVGIGYGITGSVAIGYLFGVAVVLAAIFGLGLLVEARWQHDKALLANAVVARIPLVGKVHELTKKVVELFQPGGAAADGPKSMSPVWCHIGGVGGAAALALLGNAQPVVLQGRNYLAVLIPTAPVPVGGGLLFVPEEWVTPADVGIEAVTSIYVSMGLTSPQHLSTLAGNQSVTGAG